MYSHELAKILLENENLPIAIQAYKHHYNSEIDNISHGKLHLYVNNKTYKEMLITPDTDVIYHDLDIINKIF